MNQIKSKFLSLNWKDVFKGFGLSVGNTATYAFGILATGVLPTAWLLKSAGAVFIGTFGTYLVKNFFTNSSDQFMKKEN
jgi:hypothetical protein